MNNQNLMNMALQVIRGSGNKWPDYTMLNDAISTLGIKPDALQETVQKVPGNINRIGEYATQKLDRYNQIPGLQQQLYIAQQLLKNMSAASMHSFPLMMTPSMMPQFNNFKGAPTTQL